MAVINGTNFRETIFGTDDADVIRGFGNDTLPGDGGIGFVPTDYLFGRGGSDTIFGGDGRDQLNGESGNDFLYGEAGDDFLNGGSGADAIRGESGTDTLVFGRPSSGFDPNSTGQGVLVTLASTNTGSGGTGRFGDAEGDTYESIANVWGGEGNDTIRGSNGFVVASPSGIQVIDGDNELRGFGGSDNLSGNGGSDRLSGDAGNDSLYGGAQNDSLFGDGDNDFLLGGTGADLLSGGAGIDTASYVGSSAGVTVSLDGGVGSGGDAQGDTILASPASGDVNPANFVENAVGSEHDDRITGNDLDNELFGSGGDDTLSGGDGNDLLLGNGGFSGGNDVLIGGRGADQLLGGIFGSATASYETSGAGVVVNLATGFASGGDAAGDTISDVPNLTGSAFGDVLTGKVTNFFGTFGSVLRGLGGNDILNGSAVADTLEGGIGDDILDGGAGADSLDGGLGFDVLSYFGDAVGVVVNLATGRAAGGDAEGDRFARVERVDASNAADRLVGSTSADQLYAWGGDDTIVGGAGDDLLNGADGDDVVDGGAGADRIFTGHGVDRLSYADSDAGVTIRFNAVNGIGRGGHAQGDYLELLIENIVGSRFADSISATNAANRLDGLGGNDLLAGRTGDDTLFGGDGRDILDGDVGADFLLGGAGDDFFRFDNLTDSRGGAGIDRIADFSRIDDLVHLAVIDANTLANGNQAFAFIGGAAFTGAAGQLRTAVVVDNTYLYADVNGDRASDLTIRLDGALALNANDFVL